MAAVRCSLKPVAFSVALLSLVLLQAQVFGEAVVTAVLLLPPVAAGCANGVGVPGATDEVSAAVVTPAAAGLKVVALSPAPRCFGALADPANPTRHRIAELGVESHFTDGSVEV